MWVFHEVLDSSNSKTLKNSMNTSTITSAKRFSLTRFRLPRSAWWCDRVTQANSGNVNIPLYTLQADGRQGAHLIASKQKGMICKPIPKKLKRVFIGGAQVEPCSC